MGRKIGEIYGEIKMKNAKFNQGLKASRSKLQAFSKGAKIAFTAIAVAAAAAGAAMVKVMRDIINLAVRIDKASKVTGITAEEFQKLTYAAEQEHASLEALEKGLVNLTVRLGYAGDGLETYLRYFRALGIEYRNQDGTLRKTIDVFMDISDVAARGEMTTEKLSAIVQLFGARMAKDLIPMLKKGSGWWKEMGDEIERTGAILSEDMVVRMKAFTDEMKLLETHVQGGKVAFAEGLFPALDSIVKLFTEGTEHSKGFRDSLKDTGGWIGGMAMRVMDFVNMMRKQMLILPSLIVESLKKVAEVMAKIPVIGKKAEESKQALDMLSIGFKEQFKALEEGGSYYDKYIANLKKVKEESEETEEPIKKVTKALNMQLEVLEMVNWEQEKIKMVTKDATVIAGDFNVKVAESSGYMDALQSAAAGAGAAIGAMFQKDISAAEVFRRALIQLIAEMIRLKTAAMIGGTFGGPWGAFAGSLFGGIFMQHGGIASGSILPQMSQGIATGPTQVIAGEGKSDELVYPVDRLGELITVEVYNATPETYVKTLINLPDSAKDEFHRGVTIPASERQGER